MASFSSDSFDVNSFSTVSFFFDAVSQLIPSKKPPISSVGGFSSILPRTSQILEYPQERLDSRLIQEDEELLSIVSLLVKAGIF